MARAIGLLVLVGGCDIAFGLDRLELEVTGQWIRQYELNGPTRTPILEERPFAENEVTFTARSESGEPLEFDYDYDTGAFSFRPPSLPYRVRLDNAQSSSPMEMQLDLPSFEHAVTFFSRPDAAGAVPDTTISGTITGAGPNTHLITTGLWTDNLLPASPGTYSLDWKHSLISGAAYDRLYFTRFSVVDDALVITELATHDTLEMVGGAANPVNVTLAPVPQPYCANLIVPRNAEAARLRALHPSLVMGPGSAWGVYATPNMEIGPSYVVGIAYDVTGNCESCTFHYSSPFAGFQTLANMGAQVAADVPGLPFKRYAGTTMFDRIEQSVTCDTYEQRSGVVAVTLDIVLDGMLLETNGIELARKSGSALVTWSDDGAPADAYIVDVVEATAASTFGTAKYRIVTNRRSAMIDWSVFEPARPYAILVRAFVGLPEIAAGNFKVVSYPYAQSYLTSAVFYVP